MSSIDVPAIPEKPTPETPRSLVIRYGYLRMIGEFPYEGEDRPLCGAKVVLRTRRGTELGEVLATACSNSGCGRSVSREQMLAYVENSGGDDYPFSSDGRVLRIATAEEIQEQARIEQEKPKYLAACQALVDEMQLPMKLVDVELLLGGEMATFFFLSENRVDFRNLVKQLASQFHTRIQMHQVGARDEARLVADYETCGQHCCCRQFLKVLRPVNMSSAKMQKATLDPSKISGRCGRLKCCLRYEEATYDELRKRLPKVGTRVRTPDGEGVVEETMILTQLVRVRLADDRFVALTVEELLDREGGQATGARPPRRGNVPERDVPARSGEAVPEKRSDTDGADGNGARQERSAVPAATVEQASPRQQPKKPEPRQERSRSDGRGRPRREGRGSNGPATSKTPAAPSTPAQAAPPVQNRQPVERPPAAADTPASPAPVSPQVAQPAPSSPPNANQSTQQTGPGMGMLGRRRRRGRGRGRDGRDNPAAGPANPPADSSDAGE